MLGKYLKRQMFQTETYLYYFAEANVYFQTSFTQSDPTMRQKRVRKGRVIFPVRLRKNESPKILIRTNKWHN